MRLPRKTRSSCVMCWLFCWAVGPAVADDAAALRDEPAETIVIVGKRSQISEGLYQRTYELAKKVAEVGGGRVGLGLRLEPANSQVSLLDLAAGLESDSKSRRLGVLPGGIVMLVADPEIASEQGTIWINKAPGDTRVRSLVVRPNVFGPSVSFREVKEILTSAERVTVELTPRLLRWTLASKWRLSICRASGSSAEPVVVKLDAEVLREIPLETPEIDDAGVEVRCANLTRTAPFPDAARIVLPGEMQALVLN